MAITVIQGYMLKRAMKSGKNWKKRYFMLDSEGYLSFSDKKGSPIKKTLPITPTTQIDALKEMGEEGGISITGSNHQPLYLRADSQEVADGWIRALNIMKHGGTTAGMDRDAAQKGATLRKVYAKTNALGGSGSTLERKKKGRNGTLERKNTLERKKMAAAQAEAEEEAMVSSRPISFNPALIPPPPPSSADADEGLGGLEQVEAEDDIDEIRSEAEDDDEGEEEGKTSFKDGYVMRIGTSDYFVDSLGWEYYESREAFKSGAKPLGRAILSMLV